MDTTPHSDPVRARTASATPADPRHCPEVEALELKRLAADISARLRRVCAHLPEDEFSALVLDIARIRLRYEQRVFGHHADGPPRRAD